MKKYNLIYIIAFFFAIFGNLKESFGQATSAGNGNSPTGAGEYLGWTSGTNATVNIKNEDNQRIDFLTNTGAGGTTPIRMSITGGGKVGIGTTAPNFLLHQDGGSGLTYHQFTNNSTNATSTDGFVIGIASTGEAILKNFNSDPIQFYTQNTQRMEITAGGKVGIGTGSAANLLHQHNSSSNSNTYHQFSTATTGQSASDGFTVGLSYLGGQTDAEFNLQENTGTINFLSGASGSNSQKMTMLNDGQFGIGVPALTNGWLEVKPITNITIPYAVSVENNNATTTTTTSIGGIDVNCTIARSGGSYYNNGINIITGGSSYANVGVNCTVDKIGSTFNTGGYFQAKRGDYNRGIVAEVNNTGGSGTAAQNIGVQSIAQDASTYNKGFEGTASGSSATANYGIDLTVADAVTNYGVNALVNGTTNTTTNYGADLIVTGTGTHNYGASVSASGAATENYGVNAEANGLAGSPTNNYALKSLASGNGTNNYGLHALAQSGTNNIGVRGWATGGTTNYGVYGVTAQNTSGCTMTGSTCSDAAVYADGDLVWTGNSFKVSDQFLKQNINPLTSSLAIIDQLMPKTYNFKTQTYPQMNLPDGLQYGVIAEDIELVLPTLVKEFVHPTDSIGIHPDVTYKGVDYVSLVPILLGGIKEQQVRIDSLVSVIGNISARPSGSNNNQENMLKVNLSDNSEAVIFQNEPNPFSNQTTIRYFIPENSGKAFITFYDNMGKTLKEISITEKGMGSVEVNAETLKSAIYIYSLTVNGKVIDTKRMMKTK